MGNEPYTKQARLAGAAQTCQPQESLGERGDVLHLARFVDAVLHGPRVFCTRTIEHAFDASNMVLGPLSVWQANGLCV